jgi:hypothetical protein
MTPLSGVREPRVCAVPIAGGKGERMTESAPYIDHANLPIPKEGIVMTMFITVGSS